MRNFIESNIGRLLIFFGIVLCFLIGAFTQCHGQTPQQVYDKCIELEIKHPEIVTRQYILETGNGTCRECSYDHNNLFGFRWKKEYIQYDSWEECMEYYKWWQDKWYKGQRYYDFLECIWKHSDGTCVRFATNPTYISELKAIKLKIEP